MVSTSLAIGIDLGGTHIKSVLLDPNGNVLQQLHTPTQDHGEEAPWKAAIKQCYVRLKEKAGAASTVVGISAPGIPNEDFTAIACMPGRLEGLEGFVWAEYLGLDRVPIVNDAVSALIAEHYFGAGQAHKNLVLITLGTGVGGALMIEGKIHLGFMQKAGHFGHLSADTGSHMLDITHIPGSLEDAMGNHNVSLRSYGKFQTSKQLVDAYIQGDPIATYTWLTSVQKLAVSLSAIGNMVSPTCILLGGGIAQAEEHLFKPLEAFMDVFEWRLGAKKMDIQKVKFNDFAGAIGAAQNAFLQSNSS